MSIRIGWYVHHHGGGHLARMRAIVRHLDAEISCFSSLPKPDGLPENCSWTLLERDDDVAADGIDPATSDPTADGLLHWAPIGHAGHLRRLSRIASALAAAPCDAFVVDVSMEVALFVRLLGIRTVVVAQPGRRDDRTHALGYRSATTILAPWPDALLQPAHLHEWSAKTVYTGGISRFEDRMPVSPSREPLDRGDVVLLGGRGGGGASPTAVDEAAISTGCRWRNLGGSPGAGWSEDPWSDLISARVVVAWAGQNSVADLAAASAAAVVIPQERPFAEQRETARALERAGLAIVSSHWPSSDSWPDLIDAATALRADWSGWQVAGAAARAADVIDATARGCR